MDQDPLDGLDNDGDGLFDEDPVDFESASRPVLDPDQPRLRLGWVHRRVGRGSVQLRAVPPWTQFQGDLADSDGDGFSQISMNHRPEASQFDPESHPIAFAQVDLDFYERIDDRIWLEPILVCCPPPGLARSVVTDSTATSSWICA